MGHPLVHPASWTSYLVCCAILAQLNRTWYLWYPPRVVAPACNPSKLKALPCLVGRTLNALWTPPHPTKVASSNPGRYTNREREVCGGDDG